jgi:hypothetical protein
VVAVEEVAVNNNVVEIRPGTAAQTDRERDFVDYLLQKLRDYREMGVEVDSLVMMLTGTRTEVIEGETEVDDNWLGISRFISEDRSTEPTLAFLSLYFQKYVTDGIVFSE